MKNIMEIILEWAVGLTIGALIVSLLYICFLAVSDIRSNRKTSITQLTGYSCANANYTISDGGKTRDIEFCLHEDGRVTWRKK